MVPTLQTQREREKRILIYHRRLQSFSPISKSNPNFQIESTTLHGIGIERDRYVRFQRQREICTIARMKYDEQKKTHYYSHSAAVLLESEADEQNLFYPSSAIGIPYMQDYYSMRVYLFYTCYAIPHLRSQQASPCPT